MTRGRLDRGAHAQQPRHNQHAGRHLDYHNMTKKPAPLINNFSSHILSLWPVPSTIRRARAFMTVDILWIINGFGISCFLYLHWVAGILLVPPVETRHGIIHVYIVVTFLLWVSERASVDYRQPARQPLCDTDWPTFYHCSAAK